jgi:hypothetical protein
MMKVLMISLWCLTVLFSQNVEADMKIKDRYGTERLIPYQNLIQAYADYTANRLQDEHFVGYKKKQRDINGWVFQSPRAFVKGKYLEIVGKTDEEINKSAMEFCAILGFKYRDIYVAKKKESSPTERVTKFVKDYWSYELLYSNDSFSVVSLTCD